jgi:FHS family Na+ dependent glucose MFS transporter 1
MHLLPNGQRSKTIGYYAAFFALGLATAALGPTLPSLAEHTQTDLSEISFLFIALSLGYLIGAFQSGRLYDRVAGHPLMAAGLIIMALTMAAAPLIPMLWLLAAALLILGMAEGAVDVGGNSLLVWVHGRRVGPYMNGLHFFFGLGAFFSPIIIAQAVMVSGDIVWAYWTLALLLLPAAGWLLRWSSPRAQAASLDESVGRGSAAQPKCGPRERLLIALIALLLFLYVGAEAGFGGWIFTYAVALNLSGDMIAAYLTSAFWGALTVGRLLAIPIATRVRPRWVLLGDLTGCLASAGILILWPYSSKATWVGTIGLGFFMASIFPTALTLAGRHMTITGQITGWFLVGASMGAMILPWLIGQLFESVGPQSTMVAIAVDLVMAMGVFATLMLFLARNKQAPSTVHS